MKSKNSNLPKEKSTKTLRWLAAHSKKEWPFIITLIVLEALQSLSVAVIAVFTRAFINAAVHQKDIDSLIRNGVFLAVVIALTFALRILGNNIEMRVSARLIITFRTSLFENILKKDYSSISRFHSGELLNRMTSDVEFVADGITTILPSVAGFITKILSVFITLFVLMPQFALIFAALGIGSYLIARLFRRIMKSLHKKMLESDGKVRSHFQEAIYNILVIKVFGKENDVIDRSGALQKNNYDIKMKRRFYTIAAAAGFSFVFQIAYFGTMAWGGISLFNETLDYGTFTALLQLISNIQAPFLGLSGILPKYFGVLASAERLIEIENLEKENETQPLSLDRDGLYSSLENISFEDISFSYGREIILDHTSLEIDKGDFVAIMGISGIGKSTLLKLLLGVYPDHEGNIRINCAGDSYEAGKNTRCLFSYVPQGNMLFSGTMRDNITFAAKNATDEEIRNAMRISCVDDFMSELPEGLETMLGEKGQGLSEGQVQRIAIARALLCGAPIILLDEATSALDEDTERRLLSNLRELKDKTLVIISHKKAALDICNVHVRIENKKIVSERK